jgi:hypothetical protein
MEKNNYKNYIKNKYLLLSSIHNAREFLSKQNNNDNLSNIIPEISNENIIIQYLLNPKIIFNDKSNLINLIIYLNNLCKDNDNIIFPFIDICPNLVKAYIESDIDEEKIGEYNYMKIFSLLNKCSFISKQNLFPIYSFFSDIFYDLSNIKENDIRLKKLIKVVDLWLIFYSFNKIDINGKEKNEFKESSICFLGGSLNIILREEISIENKIIEIKIDFLRNEYMNLIKEENSFLKINNNITITYKDIQKYLKDKIYSLVISIEHKKIIIHFNYSDHSLERPKTSKSKDKIKSYDKKINSMKIKDIIILDNYYGEVKQLIVSFKKIINKKETELISENIYKPFLETNSGFLKKENDSISLEKDFESSSGSIKRASKINMLLKITERNFTKVNYINYGESDFNIVEYFGNEVQLLPFAYIIQKLLINDNIKIINSENKDKVCFMFLDKVSQGLFNCVLYNKYDSKTIKKYFLFVYSILLEIVKAYNKGNKEEKNFSIKEILTNIFIFSNMHRFDKGEFLIDFYIKLINSFGDSKFETTIKELVGNVLVTEKKAYPYADTEDFIKLYYLLPEKTYGQIYKKLMRDLFIYNRMWSQKQSFFGNKNADNNKQLKSIKYKQMNYYSKNFQQPILYPILELDKYYPEFSKFKIENLFKNPNENILNYNFSLSDDNTYINNIISKYIEKYLRKQQNQEKCCLVKKTHHVKGTISIIEMDYNGVDCFELYFFASQTQISEPRCNNPENSTEDNNNENSKNLCYGSIFPCPKGDYGIIFNIKSKDILFILIREYYHRVSAIEIFTSDNKSYYFNFNNFFTNDKNKNLNDLLKKISNYFEKIKINIPKQDKNILLGFYNPDYQHYLYPLFSEEINIWNKKNKCFSNYDKLILINLLSNRSFKDIYQYPIFPMFYEHIGIKERDMNKHIGLLDINEESSQRKKLIMQSYDINKDEIKFQQEPEEVYLFNTHYSNPIYTCNYLIRIFPYSFIGIEFQGEGFDDPNRLFYSIPKTMRNTLSQKSDYREMIPELFYMPEIFENINNLYFKQISSGENIDNVQFFDYDNNKDENKNKIDINSDNYINFQKYKFLAELRENLDNEKKINQWIDLIFGVEQKENENQQFYFEKQSYINFENNSELYNNPLSLQSIDFGLIPFQLFYEKFPISYNHMQYFYQLKSENTSRFEIEHKSEHDPKQCFVYKGRSFISSKYLDIIKDNNLSFNNMEDEKSQGISNNKERLKYEFIGDVFGFVTILTKKMKKRERFTMKKTKTAKENINNDNKKKNKSQRPSINMDNSKEEKEYCNIIKLCDHYKQIKYIDYNPRLNLFLTYALDGYINIYTFPKVKLVKVIKIDNFYENEDYLKKVVLISNPFPMIFCHNETKMFIFSINGELIRSRNIEAGTEFIPCIDKDLGLIKDHVEMRTRIYQNNKNTVLSKDLYFPLI